MLMRSAVVSSRIALTRNHGCKPTVHCFGRGLGIHGAGVVLDAACSVSGLIEVMRRDDRMAVQGGGKGGVTTSLEQGLRETKE